MSDITEERAILERLALEHKSWRDRRPPPSPPLPLEEEKAMLADFCARLFGPDDVPDPQDVEMMRRAREDPPLTVIRALLSVVGWRLYAKGGAELVGATFRAVERDHHPGFAQEAGQVWKDIGFPDDPRGRWSILL